MIDKRSFGKYIKLDEHVSIAPLVIFRIIFGALLFFGSSRFLINGWVESLYIQPDYFFGYLGFEWVQPLPGNWMYLPFILMLIGSLGIIFGGFYRTSALIYFICFTYVELLDKSNYLNHYYFVSLMSFLLILVPANRNFSLDVYMGRVRPMETVQKWSIGILKFQLAVVYIFAGIAKLNSDWLFHAQPLKTWLQAHHNIPLVGQFLQEDWLAYAFSWTGCLYDLFIVFFLINSKTRRLAYFAVVFFHFVTWYLFPIGVFPWVMIFSTWIFFSTSFHQKILAFLRNFFKKSKQNIQTTASPSLRINSFLKLFLIVYISLQILIPFRYLLYPGNLFWNEEGFRFSWRVMLMHKEGHATFFLKDKATGRELEINNAKFLTVTQEDQMATQPDMILQYAQIIKEHYDGKTLHFGDYKFPIEDPSVHAEIYVSLNGRPAQLFVDKSVDLTEQKYNLSHRNWIEPFQQ